MGNFYHWLNQNGTFLPSARLNTLYCRLMLSKHTSVLKKTLHRTYCNNWIEQNKMISINGMALFRKKTSKWDHIIFQRKRTETSRSRLKIIGYTKLYGSWKFGAETGQDGWDTIENVSHIRTLDEKTGTLRLQRSIL